MMFNILIDTGYWISLYDPSRNPMAAKSADEIMNDIQNEKIIIPFPTLYEFVDSRLGRRESKNQFEQLLKKPNIIQLSDGKYRKKALDSFFLMDNYGYSDISLVDEVIKLIIIDKQLKIDYLISFDETLRNYALSHGVRIDI